MNQEIKRIGRFTSSQIGALMSNGKAAGTMGKPALTYIAEKNMERRLGRSLSCDTTSRALSWGKACELRVFELLGLEYQLQHKTTLSHPVLAEFWSGSPDCIKEGAVVEIKCPVTLKSFCQFADCKTIDEVRENHPDGEDYYWQIISNAILSGANTAELIVYCPYKKELQDIRDWTNNIDGDQKPYAWIGFASDDELPWIPEGGYYKNLNIIRWEISLVDKALLTERVKLAANLLISVEQPQTTEA